MNTTNDYHTKSLACFKQVRRVFILTFAFVMVSLLAMYGTTEEFYMATTMSFVTLRNMTIFNITRESMRKLSKSLTFESVNKLRSFETPRSVSVNNPGVSTFSLNNQSVSAEFPGMPDPCSKPRRFSGVEDILCMKPPEFLPNFKNPCWYAEGKLKCIGYFQLFGVCKSGTSDFFRRLFLHPDIIPNRGIFGKEIWYWSWKRLSPTPRGRILQLGMTFDEFTRQFQANIIEETTTDSGFHTKITVADPEIFLREGHGDPMDFWDEFQWKSIPQNDPKGTEPTWTTPFFVHHMNPNVKLLLMLRDPVERLFSHFLHHGGDATASHFDEAVKHSVPLWKNCVSKNTRRQCIYDPDLRKTLSAQIYTSFYNIHLQEWLRVFPREQMFIFRNEDYTEDIKGTLKQVFRFLEIDMPSDSTLDAMQHLPHFYATKKKLTAGEVLQETKDSLVDLYRPHMEELADMLKDDRFLWKDRSFS